MVEVFGGGPSNGMQRQAVENQKDKWWISAIDYKCNCCGKLVKKGRSHGHPTIKTQKKSWTRNPYKK